MYRAVDTGLRTIDVRTLTEAAQILGAGWATIITRVILPNVLIAVLSGAFLTFAIVIGEFTMASLLNRPAFGPYLQNIGANRAYEPAALAIIAFAITWGCMALIQILSALRAEIGEPPELIERTAMADPFLSIQHVRKSFGATTVVQDFNLDVERGEFVSFLGPSGCGKTTVLRMVAGFEEPTAGKIVIGGKDITRLKPNQRNVGMVFQAYALFPNLTVAQNIAFGLKVAGMPKADIDARVAEMLDIIKLPQIGDRYPYQLSGGQQQRVALARAHRAEAEAAAARRAAVGARRQGARVAARGNPLDPEEARHHHHLRHPRPGRGAVDLRPHRGDVWRQGRAGRHAVRDLQPAGDASSSPISSARSTCSKARSPMPRPARCRSTREEVSLKGKLNGSKSGDTLSLALRPEAISLGRQPGRDSSLSGEISEVHFLGSVIRVRVGIGGNTVSLDTFNSPATPPPAVGEKAEISFSSERYAGAALGCADIQVRPATSRLALPVQAVRG